MINPHDGHILCDPYPRASILPLCRSLRQHFVLFLHLHAGDIIVGDIAEKVSDFGDKVREGTGKKPQAATGTHGE